MCLYMTCLPFLLCLLRLRSSHYCYHRGIVLYGSYMYGGRELPLKILQFFKDLIKNKRKNKLKLKVKWNVTAKQRKKND